MSRLVPLSLNFSNFRFLLIILSSLSNILINGGSVFAEAVVYESRGERDPFVSLLIAKREAGAAFDGFEFVEGIEDIRLEGVVVDPQKGSYVVANGEVMAEGETRNSVRIAEIREDGVVFEINGKKHFKPFPAETADAQ